MDELLQCDHSNKSQRAVSSRGERSTVAIIFETSNDILKYDNYILKYDN